MAPYATTTRPEGAYVMTAHPMTPYVMTPYVMTTYARSAYAMTTYARSTCAGEACVGNARAGTGWAHGRVCHDGPRRHGRRAPPSPGRTLDGITPST
jgi:hypothetical protein